MTLWWRRNLQSVGGILLKRWNESTQGHCFLVFFFILCLPDHNNHYVPHRSGIVVEVSGIYSALLCQRKWPMARRFQYYYYCIHVGHGFFSVCYLCLGRIQYDLYKTINFIRILFISTMPEYYYYILCYYNMFVVICIILWQRKYCLPSAVNKSRLRAIVSKDNNDMILVKVIILFPCVIRVELIHNHLHVLLSREIMTSPYRF